MAELLAGLSEGPRDKWGSFFLDYRMLHKDGHVVWIRDSSMLVRSRDGTPLWHGVLMDISDQKQIEQELERRSAAQAAVAHLGEHALAADADPGTARRGVPHGDRGARGRGRAGQPDP